MTAPANYDLTIVEDTTQTILLAWQDSGGNPVDMTGYTVRIEIKETPTSANTLSKTGTVTTPADGEFEFSLTTTDTANMGFKYGVYLITASSGGEVTALVEGRVIYKEWF